MREENQIFVVRNILIGHCGKTLTPNFIDKLTKEFEHEMQEGPVSWAFKPFKEQEQTDD